MSSEVIGIVWRTQCDPSTKLLLLRIADVAGEKGTYWESQTTLAERTTLGLRTVNRLMRKAVEHGWLVLVQSATQHRPNEYRLDVDKLRYATTAQLTDPDTPNPSSRYATMADELRTEPKSKEPTSTTSTVDEDVAIAATTNGHKPSEGGVELARRIESMMIEGRKSWDLPKEAMTVWDGLPNLAARIRLLGDYCVIHDAEPNYGRIGRLVKRYGKIALKGLDVGLAGDEREDLYAYAEKVCQRVATEIGVDVPVPDRAG